MNTQANNVRFNLGLLVAMLALSVALAISPASAHNWYIQSVDYAVPSPGSTVLYAGWGHALPLDDMIAGDKIAALTLHAPDGTTTELPVSPERSFHCTPITLDAPGTWTVTGESTPGYYTIYRDNNNQVHHAVAPMDELKDAKAVMMSVLAHQYPKTYITVGAPDNLEAPKPTGAKIEIVPEQHPATLHDGDRMRFQVLYDGKPVPDGTTFDATWLGYSMEMEDYECAGRALHNGYGEFDLSHAGIWYIRVEYAADVPAEMASKCRNMLYNAQLTFAVQKEGAASKAAPPH